MTVCLEQTASASRNKPLPESLKDLLDRAAARHPMSVESQKAFAQGFVFAMDVKDVEELSLTPGFAECNDGWYLAARDLWREQLHYRDDETGTTLFETQSPEDLASTVLDDLQNYRLFRYLGAATPTSFEEAYKHTRLLSFFPPTHIWLGGRFIDIGEVPEVRVGGQVGLSTTPGFTVFPSNDKRTRFEIFGHLLKGEERALFDRMTAQEQEALLFQLEMQTPIGQARYKPVQSSVIGVLSWQEAKKI